MAFWLPHDHMTKQGTMFFSQYWSTFRLPWSLTVTVLVFRVGYLFYFIQIWDHKLFTLSKTIKDFTESIRPIYIYWMLHWYLKHLADHGYAETLSDCQTVDCKLFSAGLPCSVPKGEKKAKGSGRHKIAALVSFLCGKWEGTGNHICLLSFFGNQLSY